MCIQESNDKSYLTLPTAISLKTHLYSVNRHADRILEGKAGNITERTVSFDRSRPKAVSLFMLFVFCFLTVVSVFLNPTLSIYASDITTWSELQIALNNGGDVTLTQNITAGPSDLALDIPADKTVTLDLAGFTIDRGLLQQNNAAKINGNVITVNGTLILNDSNESKTGTIKGGNNASDGGGILVSANGKFIMNNGTISNNTAFTNGGGVYIASGGEFTMNDGTISNNYASGDGGGVCNDQGIFVMEDGEISANSAYDSGGGVALFTSSFTMNEGKIAGNQANNYGGGVYLYYHSTFIMNAGIIGSISDDSGGNIAKYGSGVSLLSDYTKDCYFTMNGGMITNNGNPECAGGGGVEIDQGIFTLKNGTLSVNQARFGGGIYNGSGTFSMEGGEITDNTAMDIGGGVYSAYSYPNIIFTMQGNVRVEGNNSPFGPDNFNLIHKDQGPNTITITGPLEGSVGITKSTLSPYTPTKGWFAMAESGLLSEKDKNVFFSDNPNFAVDKKTSPASVYLVDGVYSLTFNSNGAESGNLPDVPRKYLSGDTITVPDNTGNLVKTRYVFNGWSTVSNPTTENPGIHYDVGDTFDITENMTLYAQWYIIPATIPTINTQPADVELPYGYAEHILSVAAAAAEDADYTLSYQWYSNTSKANTGGTIIENATNNSYTIPIGKNVGITEYYYCVITATRDDNEETATVASNAVSVTITKAVWESKTATGSAMYGNSGEADLSGLIAPGSTVGNIIFKDENGYETTELPEMLNDIPTITSGLLRYVFKNDAANVNKTVVIYIPVSNNANFSDYEIAVTLTVLDKNKESLTITQNGTTFGTELPDPVYATPEGTSQTLNYSGMLRKDGSSYGPTHIRPTEAGIFSLLSVRRQILFIPDPLNLQLIPLIFPQYRLRWAKC